LVYLNTITFTLKIVALFHPIVSFLHLGGLFVKITNMNEQLKTKHEITAWLDQMEVGDYELHSHAEHGFVVDVMRSVDLSNKELHFIPVKFRNVSGFFDCSYNNLSSLENTPDVTELSFDCSDNKLLNLQHCPLIVKRSFFCCANQLTNFSFFPQTVVDAFFCHNNPSLGSLQNITDFSQLFAIHQAHSIQKEKDKLCGEIDSHTLPHRSNIHKI